MKAIRQLMVIAAVHVCVAVSPVLAKDIVIAQIAPFGGPLAVSGRDFNLGAMIAFDEVNASGGIAGNRVRLVSRDDGYRAADTARLVQELIATDNPVALIGMWGAENVQAVIDKNLLDTTGLPVIGVRSGSATLRTNTSIFHVRASYRDEILRILEQVQTIGSSRVAVVYEDDGFGREAWADTQALLAKRGLKPVAVATQGRNDIRADATADKIAAADPQAVLIIANTAVAGAVIKSLRARKMSSFIFTTSTVDAEQLVVSLAGASAGVSVAQGVPNPYKAVAPIAREFQRRIKALGIDEARANFASLEGYITARIVVEGLKRSRKDPGRNDLVRGLESLQQTDLGGFIVDFGPGRREGSRYVDLSIVGSDGRIRQ